VHTYSKDAILHCKLTKQHTASAATGAATRRVADTGGASGYNGLRGGGVKVRDEEDLPAALVLQLEKRASVEGGGGSGERKQSGGRKGGADGEGDREAGRSRDGGGEEGGEHEGGEEEYYVARPTSQSESDCKMAYNASCPISSAGAAHILAPSEDMQPLALSRSRPGSSSVIGVVGEEGNGDDINDTHETVFGNSEEVCVCSLSLAFHTFSPCLPPLFSSLRGLNRHGLEVKTHSNTYSSCLRVFSLSLSLPYVCVCACVCVCMCL